MTFYGVAAAIGAEQIYQELREGILSLRYKPGQLLSENAIAAMYEVSRSPVRGVFTRLANENLLQIIPQKGSYVSLIDFNFIREIIYMRTMVERDILKQATVSFNNSIAKALTTNLKKQKKLAQAGRDADLSEYYKLDSDFHRICFQHVGRDRLWQILQEYQVHYRRFRMLDIISQQILEQLVNEHEGLLAALSSGDQKSLDTAIGHHLEDGMKRIEELVLSEHPEYFIVS